MTVHTEGDLNCDICNIPFTRPALTSHMRRLHPDIRSNELVKKALERHMITNTAKVIFTFCSSFIEASSTEDFLN